MNQISPSKEFVITWNGADPSDTSTLYVQAVVYNAHSSAVLKTVNLIDRGSHYFSAPYITPPDPNQTGTGLQIAIVITVYTDSGYTTPSQNYARISQDYLVKKLVDANSFWGAGGDSWDPKEMRKLIKEELAAMKFPEFPKLELPKQEKLDDAKLKQEILKGVKEIVSAAEYPEAPETDLRPVLSALTDIRRELASLPKFKETDLSSITRTLSQLAAEVRATDDEYDRKILTLLEEIKTELQSINEENARLELGEALREGRIRVIRGDTQEERNKHNALQAIKAKYIK